MLQNLQNFAIIIFQKLQLDNLVDFEKCCKTRIFLQKSVPIQPKTSDILPKICQKLATNYPTGPCPTVRGPDVLEATRGTPLDGAARARALAELRGHFAVLEAEGKAVLD